MIDVFMSDQYSVESVGNYARFLQSVKILFPVMPTSTNSAASSLFTR